MKFFSDTKTRIEEMFHKVGLELVEDWHKLYKKYSVISFVLLGAAPDIYNLALTTGFLTGPTAVPIIDQVIKGIAFFGGVSRLVKVKAKETSAEDTVEDRLVKKQ